MFMDSYENNNTSFDENDTKLYPNKENFNCFFQDDLFGKEGKFFFPGNFEDALVIVSHLFTYNDLDYFFSNFDFPLLLENKLKSWSCSTVACSALYYYLNAKFLTVLKFYKYKENQVYVEPRDWRFIISLIYSPVFGRDIFSFVNRHQIKAFSPEGCVIGALKFCLIFPFVVPHSTVSKDVPPVKVLYRLLKLTGIDKNTIRSLIKTTFADKTPKKLIYYLHDLRHSSTSF